MESARSSVWTDVSRTFVFIWNLSQKQEFGVLLTEEEMPCVC